MRIQEGSEDPEWLHASTGGTIGVSRGYRPQDGHAIQAQEELAQDIIPGILIGKGLFNDDKPAGVDETAWKRAQARKFLRNEALILGGICAAPVVYRLGMASSRGKRAKVDDKTLSDLNDASNRIVALAASLGPAAVIPLTYITVDKMETAEYISGPLGDRVQTLIGLICAAPVAGAALSFLKPGK